MIRLVLSIVYMGSHTPLFEPRSTAVVSFFLCGFFLRTKPAHSASSTADTPADLDMDEEASVSPLRFFDDASTRQRHILLTLNVVFYRWTSVGHIQFSMLSALLIRIPSFFSRFLQVSRSVLCPLGRTESHADNAVALLYSKSAALHRACKQNAPNYDPLAWVLVFGALQMLHLPSRRELKEVTSNAEARSVPSSLYPVLIQWSAAAVRRHVLHTRRNQIIQIKSLSFESVHVNVGSVTNVSAHVVMLGRQDWRKETGVKR